MRCLSNQFILAQQLNTTIKNIDHMKLSILLMAALFTLGACTKAKRDARFLEGRWVKSNEAVYSDMFPIMLDFGDFIAKNYKKREGEWTNPRTSEKQDDVKTYRGKGYMAFLVGHKDTFTCEMDYEITPTHLKVTSKGLYSEWMPYFEAIIRDKNGDETWLAATDDESMCMNSGAFERYVKD
jgi:hypothetical protein